MCVHGGIVVTDALVSARQRPPQFPLRPYTIQDFTRHRAPTIPIAPLQESRRCRWT